MAGGVVAKRRVRSANGWLRMRSGDRCNALRLEVDDIVRAVTPEPFHAVGLWFEDFSQTADEEVRDLVTRAAPAPHRA
jgi:predicted phosphoribosyltransferase